MASHDNEAMGDLGKRLLEALTEEEVRQLLGTLLTTMPSELREEALQSLTQDTRLTVQQVMTPPAKGKEVTYPAKTASIAKLEQTWAQLWKSWGHVVIEGMDDESKYLIQEDHWEPSYFDESGFVNDLEQIAVQMLPLVEPAVTYNFSPPAYFAEELADAEREVENHLPDWIEIADGFALERALTTCLLKSEWLFAQQREDNAFDFALRIRECEDGFRHTSFDEDAFVDFFIELPEPAQRVIFDGLDAHRNEKEWECLKMTYSPWHEFYIHALNQYAPGRYLGVLRETIPQKWQNGLPIIKDLLANKTYQTSLDVVQETFDSMLNRASNLKGWTPQQSLFYGRLSWHNLKEDFAAEKQLLAYYEENARAVGQTDLANTLAFQLFAFDHFFDWQAMFNAFREKPLPNGVRQVLLRSWSERLIQNAHRSLFYWGYRERVDEWWLPWLFESIADKKKGAAWFQQKMTHWLTHFPTNQNVLGSHQTNLRLLTEDLNTLTQSVQTQYPKFYNVVISTNSAASQDSASRQAHLQAYGSPDLLDQVMTCWKRNLRRMMPNPKEARKSDYTEHANWMTALKEVDALEYNLLFTEWRDVHRRRRNLWRDMRNVGLM